MLAADRPMPLFVTRFSVVSCGRTCRPLLDMMQYVEQAKEG